MDIGEKWLVSRWDIGRAVASSSDNVSGISKYQYSWDSGAWTDCWDPWGHGNMYDPYGPGEGIHTVLFRAQNGAGLWSGPSAAAKWKIDLTPPYYKWELKSASIVAGRSGNYSVTLNFLPLARDDLSGRGNGTIWFVVYDNYGEITSLSHTNPAWKGDPWDEWSITFSISSNVKSRWQYNRIGTDRGAIHRFVCRPIFFRCCG